MIYETRQRTVCEFNAFQHCVGLVVDLVENVAVGKGVNLFAANPELVNWAGKFICYLRLPLGKVPYSDGAVSRPTYQALLW